MLPKAAPQAGKSAAPLAQVCCQRSVHSCIPACAVTHALAPAQDHGTISHEHQLPDGSVLELLEMRPLATDSTRAAQPPLLFLHGASHGAWCWAVSLSVSHVLPLLPFGLHG